MLKLSSPAVVVAIAFLSGCRVPTHTQVTMTPSADTFVSDKFETSNYGSEYYCVIGNPGLGPADLLHPEHWGGRCRTLVNFDLAFLPDDSRLIRSAELIAEAWKTEFGESEKRRVRLLRCSEAWDEKKVTWETQPDTGSSVNSGLTAQTGVLTWPVTTHLREFVDEGGPFLGWMADPQHFDLGSRMSIWSKDSPANMDSWMHLYVDLYEMLLDVAIGDGIFLVKVSGSRPNVELFVYGSGTEGSSAVDEVWNAKVELAQPVLLAQGTADELGSATIVVSSVPLELVEQLEFKPVLVQVAGRDGFDLMMSNRVDFEIPWLD